MSTLAGLSLPLAVSYQSFVSGLDLARGAVGNFAKGVERATAGMAPLTLLTGGLDSAFNRLTTSAGSFAGQAVEVAGRWEQVAVTFRSFTGSAERAEEVMGDLVKLGSTSPIALDALLTGSQRLQMVGFQAEEARGILQRFANVAAGMPGGMEAGINKLVMQMDRLKATGILSPFQLRSMERQGLPFGEALLSRLNAQRPEGAAIIDQGRLHEMMRHHQVGPDVAMQAMLDMGNNPSFAGLAQAQANTFLGAWQTVSNNLQPLLRDLGLELIKAFDLTGTAAQMNEFLSNMRQGLEGLKPAIAVVGGFMTGLKDVFMGTLKLLVDQLKMVGVGANQQDLWANARLSAINFSQVVAKTFVFLFDLMRGEVDKLSIHMGKIGAEIIENVIVPFMNLRATLARPIVSTPAIDAAYDKALMAVEKWKNLAAQMRTSGHTAGSAASLTPNVDAFFNRIRDPLANVRGLNDTLNQAFGKGVNDNAMLSGIVDMARIAGPTFADIFMQGLEEKQILRTSLGSYGFDKAGMLGGAAFARAFVRSANPLLTQIIDQTRTPLEKFQVEVDSLNQMLAQTDLGAELYSRKLLAIADAAEKSLHLGEARSPGALLEGSKEAASLIIKNQNLAEREKNGPVEKLNEILEALWQNKASAEERVKAVEAAVKQFGPFKTAR